MYLKCGCRLCAIVMKRKWLSPMCCGCEMEVAIAYRLYSFEGWIRRIIVHTCINFLKKYKKFNESIDLAYVTDIQVKEEAIPSLMLARQVIECIRLLPVGYRTVLNLYAIEGYSHKEISQMLDIEESTSRSQCTRAKTMLETILIKKKIIDNPSESFSLTAAIK